MEEVEVAISDDPKANDAENLLRIKRTRKILMCADLYRELGDVSVNAPIWEKSDAIKTPMNNLEEEKKCLQAQKSLTL